MKLDLPKPWLVDETTNTFSYLYLISKLSLFSKIIILLSKFNWSIFIFMELLLSLNKINNTGFFIVNSFFNLFISFKTSCIIDDCNKFILTIINKTEYSHKANSLKKE